MLSLIFFLFCHTKPLIKEYKQYPPSNIKKVEQRQYARKQITVASVLKIYIQKTTKQKPFHHLKFDIDFPPLLYMQAY